jgi:hypothetical protein
MGAGGNTENFSMSSYNKAMGGGNTEIFSMSSYNKSKGMHGNNILRSGGVSAMDGDIRMRRANTVEHASRGMDGNNMLRTNGVSMMDTQNMHDSKDHHKESYYSCTGNSPVTGSNYAEMLSNSCKGPLSGNPPWKCHGPLRNNPKLSTLTDIVRSPRTFSPCEALTNLAIIKKSLLILKTGVLNYLYEVSNIYDNVNQHNFINVVEIDHLKTMYNQIINDLLSSFQTATNGRLTDNSMVFSFDTQFIEDSEEVDVSGNDLNRNKVGMRDIHPVMYKNFDVIWPKGALTTYFERPGVQLLVDKSNSKVVARFSTAANWTPVSKDNYGPNLNKYYSIRLKPHVENCILCPSTELRNKGDNLDSRLEIPGGIDASGNPVEGYNAFDSRANMTIFLESILEPMVKGEHNFDPNQNDILKVLSLLDNYIKKTELSDKLIRDKISIASEGCDGQSL